MKRSLEVALIFCGAVIGAGFASGREILTYFSSFSAWGFWGAVLLFAVFVVCVGVVLQYCRRKNIYQYTAFLSSLFSPRWSKIVSWVVTFFLFSTFFVMASGCGALFWQEFDWPPLVGVLLLVGITFFVLLFDLKGLTRMNTFLTPLLLFGMIAVSVLQITGAVTPTISAGALVKKAVWNPFSSALIYVGYNMLLSMVVLVPLAQKLQRRREVGAAAFFCGGLMFLTTLVVYLAMEQTYYQVLPFELPLLYLASSLGQTARYLYCGVLLMAMLTSSVAAGYGILDKLVVDQNIPYKPALLGLCVLSVPFALMGFSNLISSLYGFFGVLGLLLLTAITWKCLRGMKKS